MLVGRWVVCSLLGGSRLMVVVTCWWSLVVGRALVHLALVAWLVLEEE